MRNLIPAFRLRTLALAVILFGATGCDLWTKHWATESLSAARAGDAMDAPVCRPDPRTGLYHYHRIGTQPLAVIPDYLELTYAENCGGAWSTFARAPEALRVPFFALATLLAAAALFGIYRRLPPGRVSLAPRVGIPLILGGALGNLADRMSRGYVVDFVHAHWRDRFDYPVFNVADVCIAIGIALMVLSSLRPKPAMAPAMK